MIRYIFGWAGPSGFGASTTAEQIVDTYEDRVKGKVILITGCNSGIGYEASKQLARGGGIVVLGCRSLANAQATATRIRQELKRDDVQLHPLELDLSSFASIRAGVNTFLGWNLSSTPSLLHILINNAGVMATPHTFTADGHEMQFGTNHLGHFLLTNLLLDSLKRGAKESGWGRVVNVSSIGHWMTRFSAFPFEDLKGEKHYEKWHRYAVSKLANIYHAMTLNKKLDGTGITAYSVHPGVINTNLMRHNASFITTVANNISPSVMMAKSIPQGAATELYCAFAPDIDTLEKGAGGFFADCNHEVSYRAKNSFDEETATMLWDVSEKLTSSTFA